MIYNIINSVKPKGDDEMKIKEMLCKIAITTFIFIICATSLCVATSGLPNLEGNYRPSVDLGGSASTIIARILGALQAVGIILIVVSIALIGFNSIMSSANEKAVAQEKYVGLFVAALIIIGGSTLAKLIASVAESIGTNG